MCGPQEGRTAFVLLSERERECRGEDVSEDGDGDGGGRRLHLSPDWVVCN